jgi:2-amino-4-hydroxy-6-hydroxymethyldihydropteridine diphosphokinase
MARVLIGLGANLGDPRRQLAAALEGLAGVGHLRGVSGLYRTAPIGGVPQPEYLNAVCALSTLLSPEALLRATAGIEAAAGRVRGVRDGPRTLDLDLLDYDGLVLEREALVLPHPRMTERAFVLVPLAGLCPKWRHPVSGRSARELLDALPPGQAVEAAGVLALPGDHGYRKGTAT